jgi:flagellin
MNVAPERSTLSLPGARLRPEPGGVRLNPSSTTKEAPAAKGATVDQASRPPFEGAAVRGLAAGLDQASSVADVALAAADIIKGLLEQLREVSVQARNTGALRGEAFNGLVEGIAEQTRAAGFAGVNLLDGSTAGGALRIPANLDGTGEIGLTARDLRPGGAFVLVVADQDPAAALDAIEQSLVNLDAVREGLGEEAKRVDAHRSFVGRLSEAVAGEGGADLGVDGARLAALQIRQTLSGNALSVSNAAPQAVLSLFR